ncbi:hypothetical protein [Ktedonospora formicarum]|uniref:hypothetical protein n=1 Tax=Ktedonospora formicarum TaxID=2778364 RepID=UPI001C691673|nr:hypothetical protein [Ktedonospora formicarum]
MKLLVCTKFICLPAFSGLLALFLIISAAHSVSAASTTTKMPDKVVKSQPDGGGISLIKQTGISLYNPGTELVRNTGTSLYNPGSIYYPNPEGPDIVRPRYPIPFPGGPVILGPRYIPGPVVLGPRYPSYLGRYGTDHGGWGGRTGIGGYGGTGNVEHPVIYRCGSIARFRCGNPQVWHDWQQWMARQ